ncbi:enoyl-CoA hydratase-related protein [Alicyclobacillus dauci]|uniref:Enoyl-CoA hydratase-related protein n=1 Tax=Alicyclobacillus dauci TaxID=1475485 RepID=A0ABY6Z1N4_9BACL|nr:enoyl-CoA hydratase-related protein [Alicyclobacillus dauci]WAH36131.1 enoyl-CoA hydratase-related protein [Alicyclobacillus dauci]
MANAVRVEREQGVATVVIDNPPLNVMSHEIFQQVGEAFRSLERDDQVVVVVLTTAGERAFAAGADIKEFPQLMNNPDMLEFVMETHAILRYIDNFPKPTIVVLDGLTLGGGLELALTFDIRIAEEHAQIGLPEVKLGLFPGGGGTQRLPRLVGEAKAKEIMFTGEPVSATDAERIGLVNKVVPTGSGREAAKALAAKMTRHSLQSLARIKQAVDEGMELSLWDGIKREAELFVEV